MTDETSAPNTESPQAAAPAEAAAAEDAGPTQTGGPGRSLSVDVKLNFINLSNDANNSEIVIFGKGVSTSFEEIAVAWRVIRNCGRQWSHPFTYSAHITVGVIDAYGNHSPQLAAENGQAFSVVRDVSGDALRLSGVANAANEVDVRNELPVGAVSAVAFRGGKPYARVNGIAPGQKAVFSFKPTIWIGVVSQVEEGAPLDAAIISSINTEFSLVGMVSADIVMTGGGTGALSTPFQFTLQNVVRA